MAKKTNKEKRYLSKKPQDCKPFIGGAEKARRAARSVFAQRYFGNWKDKEENGPIQENLCQTEILRFVPKSLNPPIDRFFACLLMSKAKEIALFEGDADIRKKLISEACSRADLCLPTKMPSIFKDKSHYFNSIASQVLLESYAILSSEIAKQKRIRKRLPPNASASDIPNVVTLLFSSFELIETGKSKINHQCHRRGVITFQRDRSKGLNNIEDFENRPGMCFQLMPTTCIEPEWVNNLFPTIVSHKSLNKKEDSSIQKLSFTIYDVDILDVMEQISEQEWILQEWMLMSVTTLISNSRMFEACQRQPNVRFLNRVIGLKKATHIRFSDDSDGETREEVVDQSKPHIPYDPLVPLNFKSKSSYCLPELNPSQEHLILKFLHSDPGTLSLVQVS